jgi:hypothetical protein
VWASKTDLVNVGGDGLNDPDGFPDEGSGVKAMDVQDVGAEGVADGDKTEGDNGVIGADDLCCIHCGFKTTREVRDFTSTHSAGLHNFRK